MKAVVRRSDRAGKKYQVTLGDRTVHFGARGYEDYTTHGDDKRKENYLARHRPTEDWTRAGMHTAGFWARHLLWNKPSLRASARDVEQRFGIDVILE